jgi:hypothetical protein
MSFVDKAKDAAEKFKNSDNEQVNKAKDTQSSLKINYLSSFLSLLSCFSPPVYSLI